MDKGERERLHLLAIYVAVATPGVVLAVLLIVIGLIVLGVVPVR